MLKISFWLPYSESLVFELTDVLSGGHFTNNPPPGIVLNCAQRIYDNDGGVSLVLKLNTRPTLGWEGTSSISSWRVLLEFNNALYSLLKGKKSAQVFIYNTDFGPGKDTTKESTRLGLHFVLELKDNELLISATRSIQEKDQFIFPKNEPAHLYQVVDEVLRATKEYTEAFFEAVQKISPSDLEEIKKKYFNSEKILHSDTPWLPLEQAWIDYKKQHNITDEDVKKVIAEEEEKEKKMEKKWWEIW